jgi:hypothetical protein
MIGDVMIYLLIEEGRLEQPEIATLQIATLQITTSQIARSPEDHSITRSSDHEVLWPGFLFVRISLFRYRGVEQSGSSLGS